MTALNWRSAIRKPSFIVALIILLAVAAVWAITAVRSAQPQTLDQRAHDVATQIQCPVCNGESVADSPSPEAKEIRDVIHEQLSQGKSEQQVIDYLHSQYGDTILESPPKNGFTSLIWLAPLLMFLAGLVMLGTVTREWQTGRRIHSESDTDTSSANVALTDEERKRYRALLNAQLEAEEGLVTRQGRERK